MSDSGEFIPHGGPIHVRCLRAVWRSTPTILGSLAVFTAMYLAGRFVFYGELPVAAVAEAFAAIIIVLLPAYIGVSALVLALAREVKDID